jgi:putative flippase GtrA
VVTDLRPSALRAKLQGSWRIVVKEVAAFGFIGALAFVLDIGVFTWLTHAEHWGALKSKGVSAVLSTSFAYFGNRYLSFSHRARTSIGRETAFFFGINAITLLFSELGIALFVYPLHYDHASTTVFIVNLATIGLGTLFRFWAYKRFVFLHPDKVRSPDVDLDEELAE